MRFIFRRGHSVIVVLFALLLPLSGESHAGNFYFKKNVRLTNAALDEIGLSGKGVSVALSPFETDATWEGGTVMTPEMELDQVYSTGRILRRDVLLWYYDYEHGEEDRPTFNVRYRVLSKGGVENAFSHKSDKNSLILATITGKQIKCSKRNNKRSRCYGRVDLDLDITRARKSGKYKGTIEITITSY